MISIFDSDGNLNENTPNGWKGIERFEARERLIDKLKNENFEYNQGHDLNIFFWKKSVAHK